MHIVLIEPEIPNNTGNIGRLCVNTLSPLHLVGALGFSLDEKHLRRAGLDYWPRLDLRLHDSFAAFLHAAGPGKMYFFSKKARRPYTQIAFGPDDYLIFGSETRGLSDEIMNYDPENNLLIPMLDPESRSINLAHAVSIALYEGLRQIHNNFDQWPSIQ